MLRAATRSVLGHKLRLVLTALSIVLGVAFVSGTFILTDALKSTFNAIADAGNSDVYVRGVPTRPPSPTSTARNARSCRITDAAKIEAVPGVARVNPQLQGTAILIGKNGKAAVNGGAPPLGFGWSDDPNSWTSAVRPGTDVGERGGRREVDAVARRSQGRRQHQGRRRRPGHPGDHRRQGRGAWRRWTGGRDRDPLRPGIGAEVLRRRRHGAIVRGRCGSRRLTR